MQKSSDEEAVRLNRFLAMLGVGSRRSCDDIVRDGRVRVDGRTVTDPGMRLVPGSCDLSLDNVSLKSPPRAIVLIMNKPAGYVCTASDPDGRPTVLDLCRKYTRNRRLFPVGRLDINTTGLILLTNDGMLCYRLTHPRYQIPRTYHVRVRGMIDDKKLSALTRLARSRRGPKGALPVELVRRINRESVLQITLREGRNRQVRRMCETVGLRVVRLRRVRYGPLTLRGIPLGAVRPLERREMQRLQRALTGGEDRDGPRQTR